MRKSASAWSSGRSRFSAACERRRPARPLRRSVKRRPRRHRSRASSIGSRKRFDQEFSEMRLSSCSTSRRRAPFHAALAGLLIVATTAALSPMAAQRGATGGRGGRGPAEKPDYSAPSDAPYVAEEVTVQTPMGHTLAGTLTLPKGASAAHRAGAIVTITGSGPQERDEAIGLQGYRPFRQYADSLGRRGIAVLRMDDRGTAASKGTFHGATSADFAEDIRAGLAYLRTRPEIDSTRLGLLGHSEGALIAPMVAAKEPALRALVLLAGIARPARATLAFQMTNNI